IISLFFCYGFQQVGNLLQAGSAGSMIISLGILDHYQSMSRGVIDTRDIIYFLAIISIFLFMTVASLERKKK
ncbi:MAG TPA: gliding motility-associated ABC transporter permease subunit GldF, partial [Bacteroidales bacterium]|nr:gliding motility-associated ABC transporter permease subunit GldF [Bacteroidales bacterium]